MRRLASYKSLLARSAALRAGRQCRRWWWAAAHSRASWHCKRCARICTRVHAATLPCYARLETLRRWTVARSGSYQWAVRWIQTPGPASHGRRAAAGGCAAPTETCAGHARHTRSARRDDPTLLQQRTGACGVAVRTLPHTALLGRRERVITLCCADAGAAQRLEATRLMDGERMGRES
jgi:hypothetical protein